MRNVGSLCSHDIGSFVSIVIDDETVFGGELVSLNHYENVFLKRVDRRTVISLKLGGWQATQSFDSLTTCVVQHENV